MGHAGRTELWHTRLAAQATHAAGAAAGPVEASPQQPLPVRVVWSPDFAAGGPLPLHSTDDQPFEAPMSPRDRDQIVILSAGFAGYTLTEPDGSQHPYLPQPVEAQGLFLSSLGGWLSSRGSWDFPVTYSYINIVPGAAAPPVPGPDAGTRPAVATLGPVEQVATLDLIEWDHIATQGRDPTSASSTRASCTRSGTARRSSR